MLCGGDEHALLLQAGGITDPGHVASDGFDLEVIKIDAAKNNASSRGRGENAQLYRGPAV